MRNVSKKVLEVITILIFGFFLLAFFSSFHFPSFTVDFSLKQIIWKDRAIESLTQIILVFAVITGVLSLGEKDE